MYWGGTDLTAQNGQSSSETNRWFQLNKEVPVSRNKGLIKLMKNIPEDILNKLKAVTRRIEIAAAFDGIGNEDFNSATSVRRLAEIAGMSERSLRDYFKIRIS